LYDANANLVQQGTEDEQEAATTALKGKKGWYFDLKEDAEWVGEKGLSSPIILDNRVFFTTYVPGANDSDNDVCGSPVEGYGKLYAVDIFNGSAVYPNWDGSGDDANFTKEDRDYDLWAGIPSGVVPVFQPKGVMLVVGGGGGGGTFDPDIQLPVVRTFWMQER
jgi:type IV pilus assembly protein PilY1